MNIAVTGSRRLFVSQDELHSAIVLAISVAAPYAEQTFILAGDCPTGADAAVSILAGSRECHWEFDFYKADWDKHGNHAGPIRNAEMVEHADVLVAFWDRKSKGTGGTIRMATTKGIPTIVIGIRKGGE